MLKRNWGGEGMKGKIKAKKIYVFCPANVKTGGPELLHQLVFTLRKNGLDSCLVYTGIQNHDYEIIDEYRQYIDSYLLKRDVEDSHENLVIVPEVDVLALEEFKNIQKAIWWLSVDNFYLKYFSFDSLKYRISSWGFLRFIKRTFFNKSFFNGRNYISMNSDIVQNTNFHLCQSKYAENECNKHGLDTIYLSDYLNDEFFQNRNAVLKKENIVAYSPAKGFQFTRKIINKRLDIHFEPIRNMTREEVQNLLKKSKVYIDFGNHPGKDRIPREARMQGCIVITGKNGSAAYFDDVPVEEKFEKKIKNIPDILMLIEEVFKDYDFYNEKQTEYTEKICMEKDKFESGVRNIFCSSLEVITDSDGNEIHYCNGKLTEHYGHGSDKLLCSFIVLNYNDSFSTENLVDKLIDYSCVEKIIVADNKSSDDSFSILSNRYKNVSKVAVIQTDKNGGYSYGNNYGIDFFLKQNFHSNFVVISNPDIFITEKDLISLLKIAKSDEKIGALAPMMKIKNFDSLKISAWKQPGYFYDYLASVPFFRRFSEKIIRYKRSCFSNELMQVDVIPGSFILMPKLLLKDGIKFDERFFLYCEERILCEKIRKAGYKIMVATNLNYDHFESISIKKNYSKATERQKLLNDSKKKYYQFYKTNNKIKNFLLFLAIDLNFAFVKSLYNLRSSK